MSKSPLEVLKTGISRLKSETETRKQHILSQLLRKEKVSDIDENWLDNDANLVDEEAIIEFLDKASDYEHALAQLNTHQKSVVERLTDLGGGLKSAVGIKKKR
ncbi:hypothetical protein C0992_007832, partial [Termitomyces sp. T32_za158]